MIYMIKNITFGKKRSKQTTFFNLGTKLSYLCSEMKSEDQVLGEICLSVITIEYIECVNFSSTDKCVYNCKIIS